MSLSSSLLATVQAIGADIKALRTAAFAVTTANVSGSYTVPSTPAARLTMTGNTTLTLPTVAQGATILIRLSGAFTVTWPASVTSPPAYVSGTTYALTTLDGGTSWLCKAVS